MESDRFGFEFEFEFEFGLAFEFEFGIELEFELAYEFGFGFARIGMQPTGVLALALVPGLTRSNDTMIAWATA